jgi:hypothetical protein
MVLKKNPKYLLCDGFVNYRGGHSFLGKSIYSKVHELVHIKDFELLMKNGSHVSSNLARRFYFEGRASFATYLFTPPRRQYKVEIPKEMKFRQPLIDLAKAYVKVFQIAYFLPKYPIYAVFYNGLVKIAKEVGDPFKAFEITTDKLPTFYGIFHPLKYYENEINEAKQAQEKAK